jgi:hypothetical protein
VDTKLYHLRCNLQLRPIYHSEAPEIVVTFNNNIVYYGGLTSILQLNIDEQIPADNYQLSVEFTNKKIIDTINGLDKAVIVHSITFNKISSPKFVWNGIYEPNYPEPWSTEQKSQGVVLKPQLTNHNYLGWNGKWTLTFSMPIFTWIHQVENLGWIYD